MKELLTYPTLVSHNPRPDGLMNVIKNDRPPISNNRPASVLFPRPCNHSHIQSTRYAPQITNPAMKAPWVLTHTSINSGKNHQRCDSPR